MDSVFIAVLFVVTFSVLFSSQDAFGDPSVIDPNFRVEEVVDDLSTPTTMAFLGPDDILVLQKNDGKVMRVLSGVLQATPVLDVPVANRFEEGLLGIAIVQSPPSTFVYLYFTEAQNDGDTAIANRVYRYTWNSASEQLESPVLVLELPINPGSGHHNGGVLVTDLDGEIFAVIGDVDRNGILQNNPPGVADDTSVIIPVLDPLHTYRAIGIRNSFGLGVDPITGFLWDTENGPDKFDEINLIKSNFNSGWRDVMGPSSFNPGQHPRPLTINQNGVDTVYRYGEPKFSWFPTNAPTAISFIDTAPFSDYRDFVFVGDFNPGRIYAFPLNADRDGFDFSSFPDLLDLVADTKAERNSLTFGGGFGAISDITVGPDGVFYVVSISEESIFKITPVVTGIHDMKVDTYSVSPLVVTQGDLVDLQATITNVGTADEQKTRIIYRDTLTRTTIGAQFKIPVVVGETVVGDIRQWDTTGAILGDHVLRVQVKLDTGFVDVNPSDNEMFVPVTVVLPSAIHDMKVDTFSVPLVVTQGDLVDLQATITNAGNVRGTFITFF